MGLLHRHKEAPPAPAGLRNVLRLEDALNVARDTHGATLVHADPAWIYSNGKSTLEGVAGTQYRESPTKDVIEVLNAAYDSAALNAYLFLWITWPILADQLARKGTDLFGPLKWRPISGGSWHKQGGMGVGYHWRGDSEPLLMLGKGHPKPLYKAARNAFASKRAKHSEKPEEYLSKLLGAFTAPGALVVDLYAGMAPMRRACLATGREYVGAEIDPVRHGEALARLPGEAPALEDGMALQLEELSDEDLMLACDRADLVYAEARRRVA